MTNEKRAEELIKKFGFDLHAISKSEIRNLIGQEIDRFQEGSSEYVRLLMTLRHTSGTFKNGGRHFRI